MDCQFQLLLLLSILLLNLLGFSTAGCERYYGGNYTANSPYEANLNIVLSSLSFNNATLDTGFYKTTAGRNPDIVYGLLLCRGDVTMEVCRSCAQSVSEGVIQRCPNKKEAVIWSDNCILRYSNNSIFSTVQSNPVCNLYNYRANNPDRSSRILGDLMNDLVKQATKSMFATGEANYTSFQKIYGLAQCTPDISNYDCAKCFARAMSAIPNCCNNSVGARILRPSCYLRYEPEPFYSSPSLSPQPPSLIPSTNSTTHIKGKGTNSSQIVLIIFIPTITAVTFLSILYFYLRMKKARDKVNGVYESTSVESLQFDFDTIRSATDNFSDANKLGEGGFGVVYKGKLLNGQEVAVKRLSKNSKQGETEFKNEVVLLAKLQHRNLLTLLGFCLEREDKLLIYEFMPNTSLDHFLFDPIKRGQLDWKRRYKIIVGITRGILYLHEDSRHRIVHRDLKASNILLDEEMNPKISDFGMARLFMVDQTHDTTSRIVGTYGYMAPEYAMHGQFSVKSDISSFGVLLLEIVSGKKNNSFYQPERVEDLPSHAWRHWRKGTALEVVDSTLGENFSRSEVMRCIHIGLLCVQENVADRPTMASVVLMLNSYSVTLPLPSTPAYFVQSEMETDRPSTGYDPQATQSNNEVTVTELGPR